MANPSPKPSSDADLIGRKIIMLTFKKNSGTGLTTEEENELAELRRQRDMKAAIVGQ